MSIRYSMGKIILTCIQRFLLRGLWEALLLPLPAMYNYRSHSKMTILKLVLFWYFKSYTTSTKGKTRKPPKNVQGEGRTKLK